MKRTILQKASEIFLKLGFKSVTMDDIANELAISKKTIYKYFKNKEDLVDITTSYLHEEMHKSVLCICDKGYNAIEENFEIKKMFKDLLKNSDDSPMFQLKKYYPKTYSKVMTKEFTMFKDCILNNIEKGIKEGLYRKDIDKELTTKFYFSLATSVHDANFYTYNKNTLNKLETSVLEYHTRAMATSKGLQILEEQLQKINY
ncbi:MAG: TetR/AcrR family transcriptional regulator [Lutibacter sp.]|uniref:TetR/AcrR family transcriptional regulator n=1 Tax=Lutibacter sp. TaxID=1925666 RepID=UPI0017C89CC8|nr:TetR/AcrR family transcriptional regulator [Lutibacter sp.]MBT8316732.1 TetR/AcrR family transcriptional regulator [Lutibacter sp.]NNJ57592.1 TetR/AcrR family transcriptional regulator [Lutibacter sp.]